jgi:hypothetical protein
MSRGELVCYLRNLNPHASPEQRFATVRELRFLLRCGLGPNEVIAERSDLMEILIEVMTGLMIESLEGRFIKEGSTLAEGRRQAIEEARATIECNGVRAMRVLTPLAQSVPIEELSQAVSRELESLSSRS